METEGEWIDLANDSKRPKSKVIEFWRWPYRVQISSKNPNMIANLVARMRHTMVIYILVVLFLGFTNIMV